MRALETLLIYVVPFLGIGLAARLLMKRSSIDLIDVQAQTKPIAGRAGVFLPGGWRNEE